jgi:hypothetical protein
MSRGANGPSLWASTPIHGNHLPDAIGVNDSILAGFTALAEVDFSSRTHFFGGRFENLYLDRARIPALSLVLDHAQACAREILHWGSKPLRTGFWLNAQGPGESTSEHTHAELDELLSGVYYIQAPQNAGDIVLLDGHLTTRVAPVAGMFLFFPPDLRHRVDANRSGELRLSLAFNFGPEPEPEHAGR